jgi:hypothetical protein
MAYRLSLSEENSAQAQQHKWSALVKSALGQRKAANKGQEDAAEAEYDSARRWGTQVVRMAAEGRDSSTEVEAHSTAAAAEAW